MLKLSKSSYSGVRLNHIGIFNIQYSMDYFEKKNDFEINPVFICNFNVKHTNTKTIQFLAKPYVDIRLKKSLN